MPAPARVGASNGQAQKHRASQGQAQGKHPSGGARSRSGPSTTVCKEKPCIIAHATSRSSRLYLYMTHQQHAPTASLHDARIPWPTRHPWKRAAWGASSLPPTIPPQKSPFFPIHVRPRPRAWSGPSWRPSQPLNLPRRRGGGVV